MDLQAAADTSNIWGGLAVFLTALAGLVAAAAALIAAIKRPSHEDKRPDQPEDEDERAEMWRHTFEELEEANAARVVLEQRLDECNEERLELLRQRARRRQ